MRNITMKIQNRSRRNSKIFNNLNKWNISFIFLVILMFGTFIAFMEGLDAQKNNDTEKKAVAQEFIKMAQDFEKKNQLEDAIEIYKRITIAFPEDLESHTQLAKLYTRTELHEKAVEIWTKLLETDPENMNHQDELFDSLQEAGNIDKALELAQSYIQTEPEVGIHYARLAKLQTAQGRDNDAISNYEKATEFGHADKEIYLKLAEHYFIIDDIEASEKALKNAILHTQSEWDRGRIENQLINLHRYQNNLAQRLQQADDDGIITFVLQKELARHFLNNNELEKAANSFKKALEMTNSSYERNRVIEELLKIYLKQDRTDLALEFYETGTLKQPRLSTIVTSFSSSGITITLSGDNARKTLINAHKNQGELDDLKTLFESKQEKDDDNPNVVEMLANIYWEANDYKQAAETFHKLSKVEPDNVRSFYYAAAAFQKSNQPNKVKEVLKQANNALASSNKRGDESFLAALATICLKNELYEPATKLANDAVTEVEKLGEDWVLEYYYEILAKCYVSTKRYEMAYKTYQKMADAGDRNYMRDQAETEMDKIAKTANLYQKWIPEQLKKVEENPNDSKAILKLAQSYENTNKFRKAVEQYEKLSTLDPENAQWHNKLGYLYQYLPAERRETGQIVKETAIALSGNGSYVEINDSKSLNEIVDQLTVSAWIKCNGFPYDYAPIISKTDARDPEFKNRSYFVNLKADGTIRFAASPNGQSDVNLYNTGSFIQLNTWTHIAGVIDAEKNTIKFYIDGIEVSSRNFKSGNSIYNSKLPLRIGWTQEEIPTHGYFNGLIDKVCVWNIARSETEIRSDMNKQLNGNEPGLVGYWKFDTEKDGIIFDSSQNNNDGKLIGNVKLERYSWKVYESIISDDLPKSIIAYQNAIEFDPTSYQNYDQLAKLYVKKGITSDAEEVYRQALDTPLSQGNHDSAINGICGLYSDEGQENKLISILEEIKPMMENSAVLHQQLGDLYTNIGESNKAKLAYDQWLNIRMKALGSSQSARSYRYFAETLLDKGLYPKTALKFAKRAFQKNYDSNYEYSATLGHACIANGLFDEALNNYMHGLSLISSKYSLSNFWDGIREAIKHTEDEDRFFQMLDEMMDAIPTANIGNRANAYRLMTQYYSKYDKAMNVENYLLSKTGFVPETRWITLGPFNNIDSMGHGNAYIPEEITQIDTTAKYYGKHGLISWKKSEYVQLDGHYNFGDDKDWSAAYVWGIVISPDERDITFRFDSDDQGTIWLNGKQVFRHDRTSGISFDRYTIPVSLKQGENTILIKICNAKETWGFYLRLTDELGNPIKDLKFKTADELLNAPPPPNPTFNVMAVLGMAEYYSKNNFPEIAMEQMQLTGIIHENAWLTLGPFDNTAGIGYNTAYISEETIPIDINTKYESANGQIAWKQFTDDAFNGYIDFGRDLNWQVSYALTTITSPDEMEVQLRFGSDDQAKVWLNGKEVYANPQFRWAVIDDNIIPVTLKEDKNTILVKVCNEELSWGFYLRITDVDGKPIDALKIPDTNAK